MYNGKKILALIPARGGSKGLKGKNIRLLNGKELIGYSIEFAQNLNFIDTIVVNSDSKEILKVAKKFGSDTILRPEELATDTAKMKDVVKYTMKYFDDVFDFVVLLQPTSPIRSIEDISIAIKTFIDNEEKYDSLMPLTKTSAKNGIIKDNIYIQNNVGEHNRQELGDLYMECGVVFVYKKSMISQENIIGQRIFPYVVKNKIETFDIDTLEDLHINESILQYNLK